jgi:hypothetical protein
MDGREFFQQVTTNDELEYLTAEKGSVPAEDFVIVKAKRTGMITELPIAEILKHDWGILRDVLLGHRDAKIMRHVTRIVGYFSELRNWNKSKLSELRDRHGGSYAPPSASRKDDEDRRAAVA